MANRQEYEIISLSSGSVFKKHNVLKSKTARN